MKTIPVRRVGQMFIISRRRRALRNLNPLVIKETYMHCSSGNLSGKLRTSRFSFWK